MSDVNEVRPKRQTWSNWLCSQLSWYAKGRPGSSELRQSKDAYAAGRFSDAATLMQIALRRSSDDYLLQLRMSRWVRYGLVTFDQAKEMLLNVIDRAPPLIARSASIDFLNLCWEREGAVAAAAELPRLSRWLSSAPAAKLRLAALTHDAGMTNETSRLLTELVANHPMALAETGYLELVIFAHGLGLGHLPQAKTALAIARSLDDGAQSLQAFLSTGDVAVVANGPSLRGRCLGKVIDRHRLVMRFNNYVSSTDAHDLGQRTDIWVRPPHPRHVPWKMERSRPLLIFTGANLRHRFSNAIHMLAKCPEDYGGMTTIPPSLYLTLFKKLGASPSSGILGLALLADHYGGKVLQTSVFGYSLKDNTENTSLYHDRLVRGDRPSRHNWEAEQVLFSNLIEIERT